VRSREANGGWKIVYLPRTLSALLIFLLLCAAVILSPPRFGQDSGYAALIDKHARLAKIQSSKIVLVGGSNVALGIDSELIERVIKKPVVNMGFGCILGLRYMLEEVKGNLEPGDIVVIMPEYDFFCVTTNLESNARVNGSSALLNLLLVFPGAGQWVLSTYASAPERIYDFIYDCRRLVMAKVEFYERVARSRYDKDFPKTEDLLGGAINMYDHRSAYNSHGDMTAHLGKSAPGLNGMEVIAYGNYTFNEEAAEVVRKFAAVAAKKNVRVVVASPPLPERVYKKYKNRADDIFAHWKLIPNVTVLGSPEQFVFPENYFFDTAYHLTKFGRNLRSELLTQDLLQLIPAN